MTVALTCNCSDFQDFRRFGGRIHASAEFFSRTKRSRRELERTSPGRWRDERFCYSPAPLPLGRVAEWQTRRIQNPLSARACRFESGLGYHIESVRESATPRRGLFVPSRGFVPVPVSEGDLPREVPLSTCVSLREGRVGEIPNRRRPRHDAGSHPQAHAAGLFGATLAHPRPPAPADGGVRAPRGPYAWRADPRPRRFARDLAALARAGAAENEVGGGACRVLHGSGMPWRHSGGNSNLGKKKGPRGPFFRDPSGLGVRWRPRSTSTVRSSAGRRPSGRRACRP